jgi:hypothetical protein
VNRFRHSVHRRRTIADSVGHTPARRLQRILRRAARRAPRAMRRLHETLRDPFYAILASQSTARRSAGSRPSATTGRPSPGARMATGTMTTCYASRFIVANAIRKPRQCPSLPCPRHHTAPLPSRTPPQGFRGRLAEASKGYAVVDEGQRVVVVPMTQELRLQVGRAVSIARDREGKLRVRPVELNHER